MSAAVPGRPSLLEAKALRCSSCGAPLKEPTGELVTCDHCGTVQKLVDARAFLDQILFQVNAFVRQALPVGLDAAGGAAIDPVARHNLWVSNVGPRLATDYSEYRFRAYNLLSHPMAALPFTSVVGLPGGDPKDAFLFQAKVQSVSSLAVDETSKASVAESSGLALAYAYALNNAGLLAGARPERYHLVAKNFADAAQAVQGVPKFAALESRFRGLSSLATGLDLVNQGKAREAQAPLAASLSDLERSKQLVGSDFDLAVMLQAVSDEASLARAAGYVAEAMMLDPQGLSPASLVAFRGILGLLDEQRRTQNPLWSRTFRTVSRQERLLQMARDVRRAQSGSASLRVAPTAGPLAVPFWVVEAPYSFQTGAAWRKHAVEVAEALLVAATFPLEPAAIGGQDPASVLTDVFSARERAGLMARVSGNQRSISAGDPVHQLLRASAPRGLQGQRTVPPLSTQEEALALVQIYIDAARRADPTLDRQLKISSPRVVDLVYVPLHPPPPGHPAVPGLGPLSPRSVGFPPTLAAIAL